MGEGNQLDKVKEIGTTILQGTMGGFSVLVNLKKASEVGIDSTAKHLGNWKKKVDLKKEYVGKYVYVNPNSSPANVIWGKIEKVNVREAGEFDLVVKHLVHGYEQYVRNDNIYSSRFFKSEKELSQYISDEIKKGNLREGSLRITAKGSMEYGVLILQSLREAILHDIEIKNVIPENFVPLIHEAQEQFSSSNEIEIGFFNSNMISDLSSRFPLESLVVLTAINNVFMMRNLAIVSDDE